MTICPLFTDSLLQIPSMKDKMQRSIMHVHIVTKNNHVVDIAQDGVNDLGYILPAAIITDNIRKPLLQPAILKPHAAMGMIMGMMLEMIAGLQLVIEW